jgi:phage-related protein
MPLKPLLWVGSALEDLRAFPLEARRQAGFELFLLQQGREPSDWKPMGSVGSGVAEIRIQAGTAHRVFYVAKFREGIYVLHAFEKRGQKTSAHDVAIGRERLAAVLRERRGRQGDP